MSFIHYNPLAKIPSQTDKLEADDSNASIAHLSPYSSLLCYTLTM